MRGFRLVLAAVLAPAFGCGPMLHPLGPTRAESVLQCKSERVITALNGHQSLVRDKGWRWYSRVASLIPRGEGRAVEVHTLPGHYYTAFVAGEVGGMGVDMKIKVSRGEETARLNRGLSTLLDVEWQAEKEETLTVRWDYDGDSFGQPDAVCLVGGVLEWRKGWGPKDNQKPGLAPGN